MSHELLPGSRVPEPRRGSQGFCHGRQCPCPHPLLHHLDPANGGSKSKAWGGQQNEVLLQRIYPLKSL